MTDTAPTILIIEDEPPIRRFLRASLGSHGYRVIEATTAREGMQLLTTEPPDVVLLDLGLPDGDGIDITTEVRMWSRVPIIVLSARGQERDKIAALDAGADDYLTKPFGVGELLARLRVALRHSISVVQPAAEPVFSSGGLCVDLARRQVLVEGKEIHLTPLEYKLLITLVQYAGKVVTHQQLLREVWGPGYTTETAYLRVYMGQLRQKIEAHPARPRYLITEPGVGYRLRDAPE
ncbi:MAG: response regulator [Roseiflexaceae bacterium]|nr:response regulator [Roseiflexaceae bacterium]